MDLNYRFNEFGCLYIYISFAFNFRLGDVHQINQSSHKLLHTMRMKYPDAIPPMLISGHQFTKISQHQVAAREYLQAYKLMPDNPLINLCGGMHASILDSKDQIWILDSINCDICFCLPKRM